MRSKLVILIFIVAIAVVGLTISFYALGQAPTPAGSSASSRPGAKPQASFIPIIPRAWDDKAVEGLEVPLAQRDRSPRYMNAEEYYKLKEEFVRVLAADHPGVLARQGTSFSHPVHIPSLIGVQYRKYLDATGLVRQRSIGDLMRYAILNEGMDTLAHFGDFQPSPHATNFSGEEGTRYSDAELYALALYIYSLKPPPNPNQFDALAARGKKVFERENCAMCHTPPLYTNNKLTPALGFTVPDDLRKTDDILDFSVGTDPYLALKTRRGTGFYKVPSLQGVWFRNAFGHTGQAETLEEWFDPARLKPDYVPKGFHLGPGPIQGHPFGLDLNAEDKKALIAFLKTL